MDMEELVATTKDVFDVGKNGLQAYCARAIQSHLHIVVRNGHKHVEASQIAAESQQFAKIWGGKLVRRWVKVWVDKRELPTPSQGTHVKVFTLLDDPTIAAELVSYLRSNTWSVDPAKIAKFTETNSIPLAAEKYIHHLVDEEMPRGLKQYMDLELFPHIQYRNIKKRISLETAHRFMHKHGF